MDYIKCGIPMYHPSPNKLYPKCEGERLDKWIEEQEVAQQGAEPALESDEPLPAEKNLKVHTQLL